MMSEKPRKQRKKMFNAPLHIKRKFMGAHLEENLLLKYDKRAVPVVKGDAVRVMRGSFKGHEDKIVRVNVKKRCIEIEGITMSKADGNKIAKPIHSSNVIITKLNLTDKWRRKKLERGLSEDAKKEIEAEAKEQIKIAEEEMRKKEEEAKALEKEEEESEEQKEKPTQKQDGEKPKSKAEKKPAPKAETDKEEPKKKEKTEKKQTTKSPEKKTTKKTPAKTTKKKEDKK